MTRQFRYFQDQEDLDHFLENGDMDSAHELLRKAAEEIAYKVDYESDRFLSDYEIQALQDFVDGR